MAKVATPELKRYLDKQVRVAIQGDRQVTGTLRGYDIFLNLVVDQTVEQVHPPAPNGGGGLNQHAWVDAAPCGMVVRESPSRHILSVFSIQFESAHHWKRLFLCSGHSREQCFVYRRSRARSFESMIHTIPLRSPCALVKPISHEGTLLYHLQIFHRFVCEPRLLIACVNIEGKIGIALNLLVI